MKSKELLRLDSEANGIFSARSLRISTVEDDAEGVHVYIARVGEHPDGRGMCLDAEQAVALRDVLIDYTKER